MLRKIVRTALPPLVFLIGVAGLIVLKNMKPKARKVNHPSAGMLVQATEVEKTRATVEIRGYGAVMAAQSIDVQPQVGGRVIELNDALVAGGKLKADAQLFRIEAADYEAAAAQQRAQVQQAEQDIELERGRQNVAAREWKLLGKAGAGSGTDSKANLASKGRALRKPQLRAAEAGLTSAKSTLRRARLDVNRTRVKAPFNAIVLSENIDLGQVIRVGSSVATLVGTDTFWVQVSIPVADLDWFSIPGAEAKVIHDVGGRRVERNGQVVRLLGDLDPVGRMARVIVAIDDPLGLESETPALLLGAYVEVVIQGRLLENVIEIPRLALRAGDEVWTVADQHFSDADTQAVRKTLAPLGSLPGADQPLLDGWQDGKVLAIQPVRVVRRMRDTVLIDDGLKAGDQLITSRIGAPIPKMSIRVERQPARQARAEVTP